MINLEQKYLNFNKILKIAKSGKMKDGGSTRIR